MYDGWVGWSLCMFVYVCVCGRAMDGRDIHERDTKDMHTSVNISLRYN